MKKVIYYWFLMAAVIVILPMLIVRSCGLGSDKEPIPGGSVKVRVYISSDKKVKTMSLEEYVKGVVAAEMPAEFELEALKAQAVAARTYAYGRIKKVHGVNENAHEGADICTSPAHCQAWISKDRAFKNWGIFKSFKYWNKIEDAVNETANQILVWNGQIVNPLYHANSGGKTENFQDVWKGNDVPYLKSVESPGEEAGKDYRYEVVMNKDEFIEKLSGKYDNVILEKDDLMDNIKVVGLTESGRVQSIQIGNITMSGVDFRTLFSLRSTNFKIEENDEDSLKVTTIGYGHGVGMSQWGSNSLAKSGGSFEEILKYYYKGVELSKIH